MANPVTRDLEASFMRIYQARKTFHVHLFPDESTTIELRFYPVASNANRIRLLIDNDRYLGKRKVIFQLFLYSPRLKKKYSELSRVFFENSVLSLVKSSSLGPVSGWPCLTPVFRGNACLPRIYLETVSVPWQITRCSPFNQPGVRSSWLASAESSRKIVMNAKILIHRLTSACCSTQCTKTAIAPVAFHTWVRSIRRKAVGIV